MARKVVEREKQIEPVQDSRSLSLVIVTFVLICLLAVVMWATTNPNLQTNRWMPDWTVITPNPGVPQTTATPTDVQAPASAPAANPPSGQINNGTVVGPITGSPGMDSTMASPETNNPTAAPPALPVTVPNSPPRPSQPAPVGSVPRPQSSTPSPSADESVPRLNGVDQR
jgi:hypothetical protein